MAHPIEIFCCTAPQDQRYLVRIRQQLGPSVNKGTITLWDESMILGGEPRNQEIEKHLKSASIFLLLISAEFLVSEYCYEQVTKKALERQVAGNAAVIPVIVRQSDWQRTELQHLQPIPHDRRPIRAHNRSEQDDLINQVATEIAITIQRLSGKPRPAPPDAPDRAVTVASSPNIISIGSPLSPPGPPSGLRPASVTLPVVPLPHIPILRVVLASGSILLVVGLTVLVILHLAPSVARDLGAPDLHLEPKYVKQMRVNHSYIFSVLLSSSKGNVPLSEVSGSLVDGQRKPLRTLLGQQNTPCAAASLIVDQTAFNVQPSQPQEYSLEQSQITWIWSVTPLRSDLQIPQEIPVRILFSGKSHCGSSDTITGPYPLAGNSALTVVVQGPASSPPQGTPLNVFILLIGLSLLLLAFPARLSIFLWQRRRNKGRYVMKKRRVGWPDEVSQAAMAQDASLLPTTQKKSISSAITETPLSIFYCYAHQDEVLRAELEKHLSPLYRSGQIINWYDGEIVPGTPWNEEITKRLNAAQIILLLISPDFVASDDCSKEMTRAIERHQMGEAHVVPIILRRVHWDGMPFADLQVLPSGGKPISSWPTRDDAFYDVVQGIRSVVSAKL
jgi:TIR domain